MPKVYLPSSKGQGIDGLQHKYTVHRGHEGVVEVTDQDAEYIKAVTGLQVGERFTSTAAPGVVCSNCSFEQLKALAGENCPRCLGQWETPPPVQAPAVDTRRRKVYEI